MQCALKLPHTVIKYLRVVIQMKVLTPQWLVEEHLWLSWS